MNEASQRRPAVLVTGSNGYIGRAVCAALTESGATVYHGIRVASSACGSGKWRAYGDIGPNTAWEAALAGVDVVVHLAGLAHLPDRKARRAPEICHSVNAEGTARLTSEAARAGVRRFVFLSSIGVHGQSSGSRAFCEADAPAPNTPYARSKRDGESAVRRIAETHGLDWVVLRPPMVYGPGAPGNFARLVRLVRLGIPLPLGAAVAPKSFVGIDNLTSAVVAATIHPGAAGRTFLVCDSETVSTRRLVEEIATALGQPARLATVRETALKSLARIIGKGDDVERLFDPLLIDATLIRRELAWVAPLTFSEGVRRAVGAQPL